LYLFSLVVTELKDATCAGRLNFPRRGGLCMLQPSPDFILLKFLRGIS